MIRAIPLLLSNGKALVMVNNATGKFDRPTPMVGVRVSSYFEELATFEKILVVDLETTETIGGIRIVEIGGILIEKGKVTQSFSYLCNPGCQIAASATKIHGICDQDVCDQLSFPEIWTQLVSYFTGSIVIAHNAEFDSAVISAELWRTRQPKLTAEWWCTMKLARKLWPRQFSSYRLTSLSAAFHFEATHKHRALPDAETALQLFCKEVAYARQAGRGEHADLRAAAALKARRRR